VGRAGLAPGLNGLVSKKKKPPMGSWSYIAYSRGKPHRTRPALQDSLLMDVGAGPLGGKPGPSGVPGARGRSRGQASAGGPEAKDRIHFPARRFRTILGNGATMRQREGPIPTRGPPSSPDAEVVRFAGRHGGGRPGRTLIWPRDMGLVDLHGVVPGGHPAARRIRGW